MTRTYLDHAATSPLLPEAFEAMRPWLTTNFGNASTLYREGKRARQALDEARATIAHIIGANPTEVVFTSGGTEANNALIRGITHAIRTQKGREKGGNHVIGAAFEHHAILEPLQALRREGYEQTLIKPSRDGFILPETFAQALRPNTVLATVMTAQNELGTIQPITKLAHLAHTNGTLFHTDAVQALGRLPFNVQTLNIDAASFSAHKLGGPQGVGAFFLKRQTPFSALQLGGGQEGKRRAGTPNIAGAVGFATALQHTESTRLQETARLTALRDWLATTLLALDTRITLTVPLTTHLPHILSFLIAGFESETLILKLDDAGFAVSGGSACSTGSLEPNHVLSALDIPREQAYGVLRISLGHDNTQAQLEAFISALATLL
ncbi:MAG: cysteine desulfurase [Coriobacteriales bacterium]|jgi:cysteine desulfurase|nr:cysteine desulfurase [Coriobacteriales bacterium]